ncbi:MAG: exodeoxyribonuclease VII small subunit [Candidatus Binatia bacterium]
MANERETGTVAFEMQLAELEALVTRLESGELPLEEALRAFEAGVGLVRGLNEQLTGAEQRVEILTRTASGALQVRPAADDEL